MPPNRLEIELLNGEEYPGDALRRGWALGQGIVESTPRVPRLGGGSKASVLGIWVWSLAVPSCCD